MLDTANIIWNLHEEFDFKIYDSPVLLEEAILGKAAIGNSARMTAGFCWVWSDPDLSGSLVNDVIVGDLKRPWNAKPGAKRLSKDVPPASIWAYDKNGIGQVGCIYTAQGFEFDYVGIIIGEDLVYRFEQGWVGNPVRSYDSVVKRSKSRLSTL